MTSEGPRGGAPWPEGDPDDRPARAGEVRTLRRWLAVVGVWAVASTAVALIALLEEDRTAPRGGNAARVADDLEQLERDVDERIAELEQAQEEAPAGEDLEELGTRIAELEADVARTAESAAEAGDAAEALSGRLDEAESRLDALEAGNAEAPAQQ